MTLQLQSANLVVDIPQEFDFEQIRADAELIKNSTNNILDIQFEDKFIKPADWYWWTALTLVNIADVHSTNKAMKYSCVYEANPLLPKRPSLERLVIHKAITLYPIYHPDYNKYVVTNNDLKWATAIIGLVAYHNYKIIDKIQKYPDRCPKVRTL